MANEIRVPRFGRIGQRSDGRPLVQEGGRNGARRRAHRRTRNRQGDTRSQCARRRRTRRNRGAERRNWSRLARSSARSAKATGAAVPAAKKKAAAAPAAHAAPAPLESLPPAPAAAKIAADKAIDLAAIAGSGKHGQILKGDVLAALAERRLPLGRVPTPQARAPAPADDAPREERVHMTKLRQTIARRLKDAQNTAAMLTTFNEVDMSEVMALRNRMTRTLSRRSIRREARLHGLLCQGLRQRAEGSPIASMRRSTATISSIRITIISASPSGPTRVLSCR